MKRNYCLRALLIQKDVKLTVVSVPPNVRLRALLIQKDVKLQVSDLEIVGV